MERLISFIGMIVLIGIAWLLSDNRKKISWRLVAIGSGLQIVFALLILNTALGRQFFALMNDFIVRLLDFTLEGSRFLFGSLLDIKNSGYIFAFQVLPTIIFFSSFMTVLYHLGIMQWIVKVVAVVMERTMKTSGAESLSASANIFVGQTEAPLVVKPFIPTMTVSELMAVMTGGMATVAGGVMAAYVGMLKDQFPDIAGHLLAASIMSAPAALVMAKIMVPETEVPETAGKVQINMEKPDVNVIDAAARGAGEGLSLAMNVGGMLLAFIALIALLNHVLFTLGNGYNWMTGRDASLFKAERVFTQEEMKNYNGADIEITLDKPFWGSQKIRFVSTKIMGINENSVLISDAVYAPAQQNVSYRILKNKEVLLEGKMSFKGAFKLSMEIIFGFLLAPLAWIMGVPWKDASIVGSLLGEKTVLNEFVAYSHFSDILNSGLAELSHRSKVILAYALCGFANFSSIAIQLGGIGGLAPKRRHDLARLGVKSMIAGTLAAFMTATIAGFLIG